MCKYASSTIWDDNVVAQMLQLMTGIIGEAQREVRFRLML
jgi:hypothetical protein